MFDKVFIIAEAGVNHNGNKELALELIEKAAKAGADAVKFQTFNAEKLASKTLQKAVYQQLHTPASESQLDMLKQLELPHKDYVELQQHAKQQGILFLSTAFDAVSLQFLQSLDLPYYKISSGELVNLPLLWQFTKPQKPLILSTGMATLAEVEQALAVIAHGFNHQEKPNSLQDIWHDWSDVKARACLKNKVVLLHCTSEYPTPWSQVNLKAMVTLAHAFNLEVGYSDHTLGFSIATAAVALGAQVIEKHFTLDCNLPGPDHKASLEPQQFSQMVQDIRNVETALGSAIKAPQISEWSTRTQVRQSIVAQRVLPQGKVIEPKDLTTLRVGKGLAPSHYWDLIGSVTKRSYLPGELIEP